MSSFKFANYDETKDLSAEFRYDDDWFRKDARREDTALRRMSLALCMSAFPSTESRVDDRFCNVRELIGKIGFEDFVVNDDFRRVPYENSLGIFAAKKRIGNGEDGFTLIALGFRGASYGLEWYENTLIGDEGSAWGFRDAADRAKAFLEGYVGDNKEDGKIKLWITGYSRSAAVANLLGAYVSEHVYPQEDVFVYTFECPNAADKSCAVEYRNIHNTINPLDFVPMIIPSAWGFCRQGIDDCILPVPGERRWNERFSEVSSLVKKYVPQLSFDPGEFDGKCVFKGKISRIDEYKKELKRRGRLEDWWFEDRRNEYARHFIDYMAGKMASSVGLKESDEKAQRLAYHKYYEKSFAFVSKSYLGAEREKLIAIRSRLIEFGKELLRDNKKQNIFYLKLRFGTVRSIRRMAVSVSDSIMECIKAHPLFKNAMLDQVKKNVEPLVYYFLYSMSRDTKEKHFAYGLSFEAFLWPSLMAHIPEYSYAWLTVLDR